MTGSFAIGVYSNSQAAPFLGVVQEGLVRRISDLGFPGDVTLFDLIQDWEVQFGLLKAVVESTGPGGAPIGGFTPHAPLPGARQVFCTGANYRQHVKDMIHAVGNGKETEGLEGTALDRYAEAYIDRIDQEADPFIFMKPVSSIAGPHDTLALPADSDKMDWELELAAVFGRESYHVSETDAMSHIAGYMMVNELSARDKLMRKNSGTMGADWLACKGGPGFLPSGPYFLPAAFLSDPTNMPMKLWHNGTLMQDATTADMIHPIPRQIAKLTTMVRALPGDILCTGSPAGNGITRGIFLRPGDVMEAEIRGLGRQRTECVAG